MKTWKCQAAVAASVVFGWSLGLSVDAMAMARKQPTAVEHDQGEVVEVVNVRLADLRSDDLTQVEGAEIGAPSYGGTGCPAGSAMLDQFEGKTILTLDSFEARLREGQAISRVSCNLAIPVTAHSGYQVAVRSLLLTGAFNVSSESTATINSELFFAGGRGNALQAQAKNTRARFLYRNTNDGELMWSACGSTAIARANVNVSVMGHRDQDSIRTDIMALELVTRRCE